MLDRQKSDLGIDWDTVKYAWIFTMGYGWAFLNEEPVKAILLMGIGICAALTAVKIKNWR